MRKISADIIYSIAQKPQEGAVIIVDEQGKILDLLTNDEGLQDVERHNGIITPGFINSHCHLELSHLRGLIDEKIGIVPFILKVQELRSFPVEQIEDAIQLADQEMTRNGIVAVGDISNNVLSFETKRKSKLFYHTFIELFGFNPKNAEEILIGGKSLQNEAFSLSSSLTAHAAYSVSDELFKNLNKLSSNNLFSIHNQESIAENEFFLSKSGEFLKLYSTLGIDISYFEETRKSSLASYLPIFNSKKITLVHNTFSDENDLKLAMKSNNEIYCCICPKANLYIENNIPNLPLMLELGCKLTIGTDSLASNNSLSILEEMQSIWKHYPQISNQELFKWATINGAEFLGINNQYGSIEKNKKPGLNLLSPDLKQLQKIV